MNAFHLSDLTTAPAITSREPEWLLQCDGRYLFCRSFSLRMPLALELPNEFGLLQTVTRPQYVLDVVCRLPDGDWRTVECRRLGTSSQFDLSEVIPGFVIDIGNSLSASPSHQA